MNRAFMIFSLLLSLTLGTPSGAPYAQESLQTALESIQTQWADIKYKTTGKDAKLAALRKLESTAAATADKNPGSAEAKIWQAIILATDASIVKGLSALGNLKKAKSLLEVSLKQNPSALDGLAHVYLGTLYYRVPGWPIAFGDNDLAEKHFKKAIAMNPGGLDANYFYGDFLRERGHVDLAKKHLEIALKAPIRPGKTIADSGRKDEVKTALAKLGTMEKTSTPRMND